MRRITYSAISTPCFTTRLWLFLLILDGCLSSSLRYLTIEEVKTIQPKQIIIRCADGRIFEASQYSMDASALLIHGSEIKPNGKLPFTCNIPYSRICSIEQILLDIPPASPIVPFVLFLLEILLGIFGLFLLITLARM